MAPVKTGWSTPEDIAAKVRRRWIDGSLLRDHAAGAPFAVVEVPLRGPKAAEIGDRFDEVRRWVARLEQGRRGDARYALEWANVGGRHFGRNRVPSRAVVSTYEQAWGLLGVDREVRQFTGMLEVTEHPQVREWVLTHPHKALVVAPQWQQVLAAHDWLDRHRGSGRYLREISAPGVDTKFAERHRAVLAAMLEVSGRSRDFAPELGLRSKPEFVRFRFAPSLGLPHPLTEVAVRAEEVAALEIEPAQALILENEITYLSVDVPPQGVVLWGRGFDVDRVGRLPWLADAKVHYWGDLDTHGFAILDRLRAWLPQTCSVLMDRETLMAHRDRWGAEDRPTSARLTRLTVEEAEVYADMVSDRLGAKVRLEQERIDWAWAKERLPPSMDD